MNNLSKKLNELIKIKDEFLRDIIISKSPLSLYEPINYLLKLQEKTPGQFYQCYRMVFFIIIIMALKI